MLERFEFPEEATPLDACIGLIPPWIHHLNDLKMAEPKDYL